MGGEYAVGNLYSALGKYAAPPTKQGRANAVGLLHKLKCSRPITRKRLVTTLGRYIK
jgi:hypothetical protein